MMRSLVPLLAWVPPGGNLNERNDLCPERAGLAADPRVLQVLALSGGYSRDQACALLARDRA